MNRLIRSTTQRRKRTANQLILIKEAGGKCQRCSGRFHPFVLDFHHRDPSIKSFSLDRSNFGRNMRDLRAEAAKCALVCSNCHREIHIFNDPDFLEDHCEPIAD